MAFAALVCAYRPDCIDVGKLRVNDWLATVTEAFVAAKKAKIAVLLDPEDLEFADRKSIMAALTMYQQGFGAQQVNSSAKAKWNGKIK